MVANIHFNTTYSNKAKELYLYYRLRFHASSHGGSLSTFEFTKNEKYNLMPKLIKLGWANYKKVNSYRKVCYENKCLGLWVTLESNILESLRSFKGWLLASLEASYLQSTWRRQNGKAKKLGRDKQYEKNSWVDRGEIFNVKKTEHSYEGMIFNKSLSKLNKISTKTISRWRKESENIYRLEKKRCRDPFIGDRVMELMYRNNFGYFITTNNIVNTNINIYYINNYSPR